MLTQIKEITGRNDAIYLDMDILPVENGKQIGEIDMQHNISFGSTFCSIIALNDPKNRLLTDTINNMKDMLLFKKIYERPRFSEGCISCKATSYAHLKNDIGIFDTKLAESGAQIDEDSVPIDSSWCEDNISSLYTKEEQAQIELSIRKDIIYLHPKNTNDDLKEKKENKTSVMKMNHLMAPTIEELKGINFSMNMKVALN